MHKTVKFPAKRREQAPPPYVEDSGTTQAFSSGGSIVKLCCCVKLSNLVYIYANNTRLLCDLARNIEYNIECANCKQFVNKCYCVISDIVVFYEIYAL